MIELKHDHLVFSFPDIHPDAKISIGFQRTLRIPDDGKTYPLPPGLGVFPLKHIDDYTVPPAWARHGGVMLPMYQSEAMWINFNTTYIPDRGTAYPFAVKVATGKIDALTGTPWKNKLTRDPQDYMISTRQPWLDGYCVEKDLIRQFVAMPLGSGYSAEEQITGRAEHGGLQIIVYPMRKEVFERRFPKIERTAVMEPFIGAPAAGEAVLCEAESFDMGLAPGGKMHQEIYEDPFNFNDWDRDTHSRCFIHIANSLVWRAITGDVPPTVPFTAKEYTNSGLPWFEYYDDQAKSIDGSNILAKLKSVIQKGMDKGENPLPENQGVTPDNIRVIKPGNRVREGDF
ncbi:MAG: hypothetical protein D3926_12465 [Desulfobacteraceae bacterium]|nr:MAG: hypothetical protein D3926_12465 [Desulfobacteraceae bacterium]